eukprot:3602525-Pleurochrysis_carterae.AAC.1
MSLFAVYDDNDIARFVFTASSRVVCQDFARVAYGITRFSWNSNICCRVQAVAEVRKADIGTRETTSQSEAVTWWMQILPLWDAIPNEFIIKHPRLLWDRLYELYCAEVSTWPGCEPLKSAIDKKTDKPSGRPPGSWSLLLGRILQACLLSRKHSSDSNHAANTLTTASVTSAAIRAWTSSA